MHELMLNSFPATVSILAWLLQIHAHHAFTMGGQFDLSRLTPSGIEPSFTFLLPHMAYQRLNSFGTDGVYWNPYEKQIVFFQITLGYIQPVHLPAIVKYLNYVGRMVPRNDITYHYVFVVPTELKGYHIQNMILNVPPECTFLTNI